MRVSNVIAVTLVVALLTACAVPTAPEKPYLQKISYEELPGWDNDHVTDALPALQKSCAVLERKKTASESALATVQPDDWAAACHKIRGITPGDSAQARHVLADALVPYRVMTTEAGLFTGYYEPTLHGAYQQGGHYQTPLYQKPQDMITADLGAFKSEWQGKRLVGKVQDGKFVPYDARQQIARGTLKDRAQPLLWVDSPVDAFFLAVQGSGHVQLPDGTIVRVGYDGNNGHDYVAIGRWLLDHNELSKPVTMHAIRAWLASHPARAAEVMNANPSYVFFRMLNQMDGGPQGAEGVGLTMGRSLAVDPAYVPLGTALWLDTTDAKGNVLRQLMVAQDTGGAIKGVVRGDIFWGIGADAEAQAGAMQSPGVYYLLLPRGAVIHDTP
ncbi:MAG: murein transglycosylase A [Alphaproteobacteria bacterium]|nr:murein transglycosylase A [Alphaproteobacteria bacterium]